MTRSGSSVVRVKTENWQGYPREEEPLYTLFLPKTAKEEQIILPRIRRLFMVDDDLDA